jgi:type II secretory pathway pseudopilin PulG
MNLPRPTIRRLMVAVAFLAILLWVVLTVSRWTEYRHRAMRLREQILVLEIERLMFDERLLTISLENIPARKQHESAIADNRQARIKAEILFDRYRKAMQHPWFRVEPDSTVEEKYYP